MSASLSRNGRKPSPTEYIDVQRGRPLVSVLSVSSALTVVSTVIWPNIIVSFVLLLQLAAAVCFCTLFVRVKDGCLMWQFGPGWIRGKIPLSEIESSRVVTSRLAYGWGFRRGERGWSFNRSGALALEISYSGGRRLRLGTSRAHELQRFLTSQHAKL